jgi:hypothetical protein
VIWFHTLLNLGVMMPDTLIEKPVTKKMLVELSKERFGDMVKAVVDIDRGIMRVGGELHADQESLLLEEGSQQIHLWGINIYPHKTGSESVEFDSMINLRPSYDNFSRGVDNPSIQKKIIEIINNLVIDL